ncbi:MAG: methyltransferase domain-containing protein [Ruminococcus sp.]|nr:methyltransferase domain-containing protein [Ruminococcus sp.]
MSIFICPVCGEKLEINGNAYVCQKRHSFDIARSGYVNLLLSKHMGKTVHGDNKLMVQARRRFLDKGYYKPLCDALCEAAAAHFSGKVLLDAGCGEGYYTTAIFDCFDKADIAAEMYGIDISKAAVECAAKRCGGISFAAASVFHIPAGDSTCDMLVTLFAPYCGSEYRRVLKKSGIMIMAIPSEEHLWELKQAVYDTPYKNEVKPYELEGFELIGKKHITYDMELTSREDIEALFAMTPYYYRTSPQQRDRLAGYDSLRTKADFELLIYCAKGLTDSA